MEFITYMSLVGLLGIALGTTGLLQFCWWAVQGVRTGRHDAKEAAFRQSQLRRELDAIYRHRSRSAGSPKAESGHVDFQATAHIASSPASPAWQGFRKFVVDRLVRESELTTSVYLKPQDARPLPSFRPGQHLTIRLEVPKQPKPVVRCYSLSDGPNENYYRLSVKKNLPPRDQPDAPAGVASSFINDTLAEGDVVDIKAPSGSFFLESSPGRPIVLLAGGVGITPMTSIIAHELNAQTQRPMLLVYAVNNRATHPFREHLKSLSQQHENLHVVTCYSSPLPTDQRGADYDVEGRASVELLQKILPQTDLDFYMCGPPPFMNSLYDGLIEWGVADEQIFFESFGPASVKRVGQRHAVTEATTEKSTSSQAYEISLMQSDQTFGWTGEYDNLLEAAEEHGIFLDSGCRAGNCGTCEVAVSGSVEHPAECEVADGKCLLCVAKPTSDLKIEA